MVVEKSDTPPQMYTPTHLSSGGKFSSTDYSDKPYSKAHIINIYDYHFLGLLLYVYMP